jgi:hypothetical protein
MHVSRGKQAPPRTRVCLLRRRMCS